MALSSTKVKTAKQDKKDYKLSDSKGLYLLVAKSGLDAYGLRGKILVMELLQ